MATKQPNNVRRWSKIQALKRKNLELSSQIKVFATTLEPEKKTYMEKLTKKLNSCSGLSLYAEQPGGTVGITGHLCGDKLCFVCNSRRSNTTRTKYRRWFIDNPTLKAVDTGAKELIVTNSQYEAKFSGWPFTIVNYDVLPFTLTVPHSLEHGFRGKQLYYDEFSAAMTELRRLKFWKQNILGGEYGFETEKKSNGVHIHVHGMAFVKSGPQNRNKVHRELLMAWNRLTINPFNTRPAFTQQDIEGIKKGNRLLTDQDIAKMDPRGATFINMGSPYYKDQEGNKIRIGDYSNPHFMRAILEVIKYHFEPHFFDKKNGQFDLQMIADIKPLIKGKPLYKKFGCLVGEKSLNVSEEIENEYDEAAQDYDENTGEAYFRDFYLVNPALMYANDTNIVWSNQALRNRRQIKAQSTREAVAILSEIVKANAKTGQL